MLKKYFRQEAIEYYQKKSGENVFPRFVTPRHISLGWFLIPILIVVAFIIWSIPITERIAGTAIQIISTTDDEEMACKDNQPPESGLLIAIPATFSTDDLIGRPVLFSSFQLDDNEESIIINCILTDTNGIENLLNFLGSPQRTYTVVIAEIPDSVMEKYLLNENIFPINVIIEARRNTAISLILGTGQ